MPHTRTYCYIAVFAACLALAAWGFASLLLPASLPHELNLFPFQAYILLTAAVILAWFRGQAVDRLLVYGTKVHYWLSSLAVLLGVGLEGGMHALNIPHPEGLVIALLGGGAAGTGALWAHKFRKKHHTSLTEPYRTHTPPEA